jgi:uncharacterized membrane protein
MGRLARIVKHLWHDESDVRRALGDDALDRIAAAVRAAEVRHVGEIRVCVEAGLPLSYLWRDARPRERAITLFGKLRVWDTEHNTGVLIYLLLAEHAIEIVADRGLNHFVSAAQWQDIARRMSADFKAHRFEPGLVATIAEIDALLTQVEALRAGARNPNELPDRPWVG